MNDVYIDGCWTEIESQLRINVLELKDNYFALKSLCKDNNLLIKIMTDNTTALAYVKHMGGVRSNECNEQAQCIWNRVETHKSWVTTSHIPGIENVVADYKSRHISDKFVQYLELQI